MRDESDVLILLSHEEDKEDEEDMNERSHEETDADLGHPT